MEGLKEKRIIVVQVLRTLHDSIELFNESAQESRLWWSLSDSLIQRFEYTIDTFWKYLKLYLEKMGMVQEVLGSPRGVLRAAFEVSCIMRDEYEMLLEAVQDRNVTSHTYNHELARDIVSRIPAYYAVIDAIVERLKI